MMMGQPCIEQGPFKFTRIKENFDLMRLEFLYEDEVTPDEWMKNKVHDIFNQAMGRYTPFDNDSLLTSFHILLMEWLNTETCPITELKWMSVKTVTSSMGQSVRVIYKSVFDPWEYHQIGIEVY